MKVAVVGYGIEGEQSYRYWTRRGDDVTIVDEQVLPRHPIPAGAKTILGPDALHKITSFDLVVRTASLSPDRINTEAKVWSATNEFFARCPAPIIGVTGTKGKGTTCSLVASILRASGQKVYLVGNIGIAALSILDDLTKDDIVVYELSSFQLWDLERSPHVAAVLMIEADHLDKHRNFEEYIAAKSHITLHQVDKDFVVYHPTNQWSAAVALHGKGKKARYAIPDDKQVYIKSNKFYVQNKEICHTDALQLPGDHNKDNACAAISMALHFVGTEYVEAGLREFTGLPHRLKYVAESNGVQYYDDSIATTPGSAIAAIQSFDQPKILIVGGHDKGADYAPLIKECHKKDVKVIAMGENRRQIQALCDSEQVSCYVNNGRMEQVVSQAAAIARPGDVVLLSPASASFDQYKNYSDRGDQFIAEVEKL